jgi:hypothetical protein
MVLADQDSWDSHEAAKWLTMRRWRGLTEARGIDTRTGSSDARSKKIHRCHIGDHRRAQA